MSEQLSLFAGRACQLMGWIELSAAELHMAVIVGSTRNFEAHSKSRANVHGMSEDPWEGFKIHMLGACGEIAVAKSLGIYWGGHINSFKGPDLGVDIQVRTRRRHDHDLIVRKDDKATDVFYLVTGLPPKLFVHGWILGEHAKRESFLESHGKREPAYFVPKGCLESADAATTSVSLPQSSAVVLGDSRLISEWELATEEEQLNFMIKAGVCRCR